MNPEICLEGQQPWLWVQSPQDREQPEPGWELSAGLLSLSDWKGASTFCGHTESVKQPEVLNHCHSQASHCSTDLEILFQYKLAISTSKQDPRTTLCSELLPRQWFLRCNLQLSPQCHLVYDVTKLTLEILGKPPLVAAYPSLTPPSCSSSTSQTIETDTWMQNS